MTSLTEVRQDKSLTETLTFKLNYWIILAPLRKVGPMSFTYLFPTFSLIDKPLDRSVRSFQILLRPVGHGHIDRLNWGQPVTYITSKLEQKATLNCDVPRGHLAHFYDTTTTTFMDITECCCMRINYSGAESRKVSRIE